MQKPAVQFEDEIRIRLVPVLQVLGGAGLLLAFTSDLWLPAAWSQVSNLGLLLVASVLCAWLLNARLPRLSRWLTVMVLVAVISLGYVGTGAAMLLTLLVVPPLLAVALLQWTVGMVVAGGETIFLLLLNLKQAAPVETGITLVALWTVLAVAGALVGSLRRVADWSWNHYQRNSQQLEEARDRQLQLNQALADLAQANEQLTRLNQLAQGLRQLAENARSAKEQFVANVSHELRTPLNMIIGFSETMLQAPESYGGKIPPALLADLAVVHRNAEHLSALIDDVLNLSQIEAGEMAITREQVNFPALVESAVTAARPLFDSKQLYLETDLPADLPLIECDPTRIREVLLNLLSNAGRFTEQGGVLVTARVESAALVVAVADTGPGIPAEGLRKLFQPFFQIDGSIRRRFGGTGLGLSICKRFIELHDGKIWVESAVGSGTTFFFTLPLAERTPPVETYLRGMTPGWEYRQRTRPSAAPLPATRPRFVVLESGNGLQHLLTRYRDQLEIVPVADFAAAQAELVRVPAQGLLVNDASVTGALAQLQLAATLPSATPALVCSIPDLDDAAAAAGAAQHLVKPVTRDELLVALDRLAVVEGTVLVVDDEPNALQLFGRMLASYNRNYRVLLARDGHEALAIMQEVRPAVILLDLIMPGMDGFQLLAARNGEPAWQHIPVIIISAQDPTRQPIVSNALAITQGGGLSVRQLLKCIDFVAAQLAPLPAKPEVT